MTESWYYNEITGSLVVVEICILAWPFYGHIYHTILDDVYLSTKALEINATELNIIAWVLWYIDIKSILYRECCEVWFLGSYKQ